MFQAEGVDGPAGLVIAGDETAVTEGLERYANAGATDVRVTILAGNEDEHARTRDLLRRLQQAGTKHAYSPSPDSESQAPEA